MSEININVPVDAVATEPGDLDVTISVGFLRGIYMLESKKVKGWENQAELDSVRVVVIARNDANMLQASDYITSAPLDTPKPVGDWMNYTAVFPLKGTKSTTKMTLPGLIKKNHNSNMFSRDGQYKRESIELLITLVFGNEAITVGKARLVVTGEEVRTKQSDIPIDVFRDDLIKSQTRSHFPMKRTRSLPCGKDGELAPVSFKYDRRRRKFQIETDAVMRVFIKVSPHNPYNNSANSINLENVSISGQSRWSKRFRGRSIISRSRTRALSEGPSPRNNVGRPPISISIPPKNKEMSQRMRRNSSSFHESINQLMNGSDQGSFNRSFNAEMTDASPGRTAPPGGPVSQWSQSVPSRYSGAYGYQPPSAYGGSSYGYGVGNTKSPRRAPNSGQMQYGGSSYGGIPRKMNFDQAIGNIYNSQGYGSRGAVRSRSQSPYIARI